MRMPPQELAREAPEYQSLAARYPHLSESIRLRKEFQELKQRLQSAKERSVRFQISRRIKILAGRLKRQDLLVRAHGESKRQSEYRFRFLIMSVKHRINLKQRVLKQRVVSLVLRARLRAYKAHQYLQRQLWELSRRSRYARASRLPPSISDMKSLDPTDRGLAMSNWIERHRTRIRKHRSRGSVEAGRFGVG